MKKIELHLHLDGSVRVSTASEILGIDINTCEQKMRGKNLKSLDEYLTRFDLPIKVMQEYDNIKRVAYELALDLIDDEVVYAEVRFAPIFHTSKLSLEDVCKAVLDGFDLVKDKIKINLILCMMRHLSFNDNKKIIDLYFEHIDDRIVGLDLAGSENQFPNSKFTELFDLINNYDIPFTIHTGEVNNLDNIRIALENNFRRIGHGINIINDNSLISEAISKDILLEVCPTSNIDTFNCNSYENHPIRKLYNLGLNISINTDDRTVSNITLNEEYGLLKTYFNFTDSELKDININAMAHSFASDSTKEEIIRLLM